MTRQNINIGSTANDGTGDPLRTAFDKINDNFVELYGSDSDATTFTNPTLVGATMTAFLYVEAMIFFKSVVFPVPAFPVKNMD